MLTKIRSKFQSEDNKRLLGNFISLSVLQGMNYILPLITFPYLVRVLGIDNFGLLAFATATIAYFNIITDYGFNLTATREVSIHRDSRDKIVEIFSSVMTIKLLLMLVSFGLLTILVFSFQKFSQHWEIYFLTFGSVIGQVLFPIWFFQGMERMKYITYLNIVSKSIFTVAVFVFVHNEADVWIVPLLTSIGFIVVGIWSLFIIQKQFKVTFKPQSPNTIKWYLIDGWDIFVSRAFSSLYKNSNIMILGILTNNSLVGYYAIAEKIVRMIQTMQDVLGTALFPYITRRLKNNINLFFQLNKKYFKYIFLTYLVGTMLVFIFSKEIIFLINGNYNIKMITNLNIMSFVILIGGLNYYFGILGLVSLNYKKEFSRYIMITGLFNISFCFIAVYFFQDNGAAITFVLSETILLCQILSKMHSIQKRSK